MAMYRDSPTVRRMHITANIMVASIKPAILTGLRGYTDRAVIAIIKMATITRIKNRYGNLSAP